VVAQVPSRYGGSAPYYSQGRLPYPEQLAPSLFAAVPSAVGGRLLDVGCGPGRLTLLLAAGVAEAVGVDADPGMVEQAIAAASAHEPVGAVTPRFVVLPAEDQPGGLGRFDLVTFALSFHWVDQQRVARAVFELLRPGGACVHVHGWSLRGDPVEGGHPPPPYDAVADLLDRLLGVERRANAHATPGEEAGPMRAAGFAGPTVVSVPGGGVVTSTVDDLVARSYSTSGASPARLGAHRAEAESQLRRLLSEASPSGRFDERLRDARLDIWLRP
jgi:SAM-dependent methyltransferase